MIGCSLKLKKLVERGKKLSTESHSNCLKLPKLEVPVSMGAFSIVEHYCTFALNMHCSDFSPH